MCYAHPGPRCSGHMSEKLANAKEAYEVNPSSKVLFEKMKEAEREYDTTPEGMKALRATGKPADAVKADIAQTQRNHQMAMYKAKQAEKEAVEGASVNPLEGVSSIDKEKMAKYSTTSPDALAYLAKEESIRFRLLVAERTVVPPTVLATLSDDENEEVRIRVARNLNTSPETLTQLIEDDDRGVSLTALINPNTPTEVMERKVDEWDIQQKTSYADRLFSYTTDTVQSYLAKDERWEVRATVASNHFTPDEILESLITDKNETVSTAAMKSLR